MPSDVIEATGAAQTREILASRGGLYGLLGRCLEGEVDAALLSALRGPLRQGIEDLGLDLGDDVASGPEAAALKTLAEEFTGLFVAPGAVSPYRSVFETGRLFQCQADIAAAAYGEAGFRFRNLHSGEFADHIAVMLGFVGRLFDQEAAALGAGDGQAGATWRSRRERFLLGQLGPWAIGWCRRARACARHDFYRAILTLAERTVWDDIVAVADKKTLKRLAAANRRPVLRPKADPEFRKASGL